MHEPQLLLAPAAQDDLEMEVESYLRRKFEGAIKEIDVVHREDLDLVRLLIYQNACIVIAAVNCLL